MTLANLARGLTILSEVADPRGALWFEGYNVHVQLHADQHLSDETSTELRRLG